MRFTNINFKGAPYKYGVSQVSKGFDEAPHVILKAVTRLTWAGKQAADSRLERFHSFNELLSIGYFEGTRIGVSAALRFAVLFINCCIFSTMTMERRS